MDIGYIILGMIRGLVLVAAAVLAAFMIVGSLGLVEWADYQFLNVFGFDCWVSLQWELSGHATDIPKLGGNWYHLTVETFFVLFITSLIIHAIHCARLRKNRKSSPVVHRLCVASDALIAAVLFSAFASIGMDLFGVWQYVFYTTDPLIAHRGIVIQPSRYWVAPAMIGGLWLMFYTTGMKWSWPYHSPAKIVGIFLCLSTLIFVVVYMRKLFHYYIPPANYTTSQWGDDYVWLDFISDDTSFTVGIGVLLWSLFAAIPALAIAMHNRSANRNMGLCANCRYDLRGSIAAGGSHCPECGTIIPESTKLHAQPLR